jgi:hypothetical protein
VETRSVKTSSDCFCHPNKNKKPLPPKRATEALRKTRFHSDLSLKASVNGEDPLSTHAERLRCEAHTSNQPNRASFQPLTSLSETIGSFYYFRRKLPCNLVYYMLSGQKMQAFCVQNQKKLIFFVFLKNFYTFFIIMRYNINAILKKEGSKR